MTDMSGTRVIVTGGGQGMGREHCLQLARRGAQVAVLDRDSAALQETMQLLDGHKTIGVECDVADRAAVERAVAEAVDQFGGLDAVVSNAGTIHTTQGLADTDDDDWDRTMAVHVGGARNLCRAALPHLRRSAAPRVVIVSSMWAQRGPGFGYAYCAAKGALLAFAKNLAVEVGSEGILVNAIAPGSVPTRMCDDYGPEEIAEDCKTIPLGRWGEAEEISKLVCFLASSETSYITGQTVAISGGQIIASF
jgi:NAD(P)-dependent dehydrogenase (short-subunit alcohol dehydrogenase family)